VPSERIGLILPEGLHAEMTELMLSEKKWVDRQDFIRHAIREKIERWKTR
jgi:metal-responsive CopG/Arc/MetJ family transcriptional regulator